MKNILKNLFLFLALSTPLSYLAQDCYGTVKLCPRDKKEGFVYNNQSMSGAFAQGDTAEVTFVVYKDMEYRMSLCSPNQRVLDGHFKFQVVEQVTKPAWKEVKSYEVVETDEGEEKVEKVTKKRVFNKVNVVRYDNSKDEDAQEFIFVSDKTRKLTIKVYIPMLDGGQSSDLEAEAYACVGLLLEHQPGPKTGFRR